MAMLKTAPKWLLTELAQAGYEVPEGLPDDSLLFSAEQRAINAREVAKASAETAVERVRRIARETAARKASGKW